MTRRTFALFAGPIFAASCTLSSEGTAPSPAATGTGGDAATSSGTGGATSTSTSGTGGAMPCTPGQQLPCYDGPSGTEGVGSCTGGTKTCDASGAGFGECEGQVTPTTEDCAAPGDEDCSGQPNDNCACEPGSTLACYSGAAGTSGVGLCHDGTQICEPDGMGYGPCTGEVTPATETCDGQLVDEDCDGATNEGSGTGCVCDGGVAAACYSGPAGTLGVGTCAGGMAQCNPEGTAFGPCNGEVLPGFDSCGTSADEDCDGSAVLCTGSTVWGARFGDGSDQIANDVGTYGSAAYVTGQFKGVLDFGGGGLDAGSTSKDDIFVAKLDTGGNQLWAKRYGVSSTDERGNALDVSAAGSVAITGAVASPTQFDPNGGVIPAGGKDDLFILVLDANGGYVWANIFGDSGGDQVGRGIAFDGAGSLFVAGSLQGSIDFNGQANDFSGGGNDAFLAKVSAADGTASWVQAYGGGMEQLGYGVAVDPTGNPVLVGRADGTMDFGGATVTSAGKSDAFVAKLKASDGNPLWAKRVGGAEADLAYAVTVDALGNIYVGGFFNGVNVDFGGGFVFTSLIGDAFVLKLDGNGNTLWAKQYGAAGPQEVRSLALDSLGNLLVTGFFQNGVDFGGGVLSSGGANDNVFVLKLDPSGNHIWSKSYGDTASQRAFGVASDNQANAFVVGQFSNTIDFGNGVLTSSSQSIDVFVAKLAP